MTKSSRFISFGAFLIVILMLFVTGCQTDGTKSESQETTSKTPGNTNPSPESADSSSSERGDNNDKGEEEGDSDSLPETDGQVNNSMSSLKGVSAIRLINYESGWAGGDGFIARSDNSGDSWTVQMKLDGVVKQLFALNDQEAWMVTEELDIYRTQDGSNWTKISKAPNDGFLHFTSPETGFIGHALTEDGGKTWSNLNKPEETVGEVYYHDKSIGWAVSQKENDSFQLMTTNDGGATWAKTASKQTNDRLGGAVIRSMGKQDAWVEAIGGTGMNQTAYSLFHTSDGGLSWTTVVANSTAGGGPAPGYPEGNTDAQKNEGVAPGPLYVVNRNTALMGGYCGPCDKPNTVGRTTDGGKSWENSKQALEGSSGQLLAMADEDKGWMITLDSEKPAVLYKTTDGGLHWEKSGDLKL